MCSITRVGRLEQLKPCVEDWNCVMNFMMVSTHCTLHTHDNSVDYITCTCTFDFLQSIWQKLVKISQRDHGSLTQLLSTSAQMITNPQSHICIYIAKIAEDAFIFLYRIKYLCFHRVYCSMHFHLSSANQTPGQPSRKLVVK